MGVLSSKISYFKLVEKYQKNCKDKNYYDKFNREYGLKTSKFIPARKITKYRDEDLEDILNWKTYLLIKLDTCDENNWKYKIYQYLEDKTYYNQYLLQNEMFIYDFAIFNESTSLKNLENIENFKIKTVFSAMDKDEFEEYSESSKMTKKKRLKERKRNIVDVNNEISSTLDTSMRMESNASELIKKNAAKENIYNSFQIKRYINFILNQLKNKKIIHPISDVIYKFCEIYDKILKEYLLNLNNNIKWDIIKEKVIKDIQEFIEIMQVALKLFYLKSINYKFFVCDKDEFINVICYFFFNQKKYNIYSSIFKIFRKSNEEKIKNLKEKIRIFGELKPKEAGINPKFCLDEDSDNFIEKEINKDKNKEEIINDTKDSKKIEENNENKLELQKTIKINIEEKKSEENNKKEDKPKFVKYLEEKDKQNEIINFDNMNIKEKDLEKLNIDEQILEGNSFSIEKEEYKRKKKLAKMKQKAEKTQKILNNNNFNEQNEQSRSSSIVSYKEFSIAYNSLSNQEYIESLNKTLGELPYTEGEDLNDDSIEDLSIPYINSINYMKNIRKYKGPLDKLIIIALTSVIIKDCIDKFWKEKKINIENIKKKLIIDSDQLMTIYLYIVYNLNKTFDDIFSELDFIDNFITLVTRQSIIGYYFTTVRGCVDFILKSDNKSDFIKS